MPIGYHAYLPSCLSTILIPRFLNSDLSDLSDFKLAFQVFSALFATFKCYSLFNLDTLKLRPGKEYNFNVVKQVEGTESFLGQNKDVINCQNEESYEICVTRNYIDSLIQRCKCLTFSSKTVFSKKKVKFCGFNIE